MWKLSYKPQINTIHCIPAHTSRWLFSRPHLAASDIERPAAFFLLPSSFSFLTRYSFGDKENLKYETEGYPTWKVILLLSVGSIPRYVGVFFYVSSLPSNMGAYRYTLLSRRFSTFLLTRLNSLTGLRHSLFLLVTWYKESVLRRQWSWRRVTDFVTFDTWVLVRLIR